MRLKWVSIPLVIMLSIIASLTACNKPVPENNEINIGALLPLTGDWASRGGTMKATAELARDDMNSFLADTGSPKKINLVILDTKTDINTALEQLKKMVGQGIKLIIGPPSSAEVAAVKTYAAQNGVILVCPCSTSSSLAIPDNVFRFTLNDKAQSRVMAESIWTNNTKAIIPFQRGDTWGDDLLKTTTESFTKLGGEVLSGIRYQLNSDFKDDLSELTGDLNEAIKKYGSNNVAVYLIAMDEVSDILTTASSDPVLASVRWYGCDGTALGQQLINSPEAARFAIATKFISPIFGIRSTGQQCLSVSNKVEAKSGHVPDAYALAVYDALNVASLSYLTIGQEPKTDQLVRAFEHTAQTYTGITGPTALDEAGDLKYGIYDFWVIKEASGSFKWERKAQYGIQDGWSGWYSEE